MRVGKRADFFVGVSAGRIARASASSLGQHVTRSKMGAFIGNIWMQ